MRKCNVLAALLFPLVFLSGSSTYAMGTVPEVLRGLEWGESSGALLARFANRATVLSRPIDFGDSYAQIVLRDVAVGGVGLTTFFQMDKATGGLKRIQLERQRHGVTRLAFRAVLATLDAIYGPPTAACFIPPGPSNGYQASTERAWLKDALMIRAVFRDTTIEALEGCLDFGTPPCGLTGQMLVRIGPSGGDRICPVPAPSQ